MGLYSGGLIIGRIFASKIWGAYFRQGVFLGELIIGIFRTLRYLTLRYASPELNTSLPQLFMTAHITIKFKVLRLHMHAVDAIV